MGRYLQTRKTASCLGMDFGDGYLVCGCELPDGSAYRTLSFPGWTEEVAGPEGFEPVHMIPALIHYPDGEEPYIGDRVLKKGCIDHPSTGRWLRNYLLEGSTAQIHPDNDRRITFRDATEDLLRTVLKKVVSEHPEIRSVVVSLPSGAPFWYTGWLSNIAHSAGMTTFRTIEEHAAIAAGYDLSVDQGQSFLVFSCDEIAINLLLVRNNGCKDQFDLEVIGTARADTGCRTIDIWIAQEIAARSRKTCSGQQARSLFESALACTTKIYPQLAGSDLANVEFNDPVFGKAVSMKVTTDDTIRILADHGLPETVENMIRHAFGAARARGFQDIHPVAVLMTGRGSSLKAVQALVRQYVPGVNVLHNRPFDAAARGAALYRHQNPESDRIRNNYALRYWDPTTREHRYRFLVHSGARFPSAGQVARITISASYDGQARLGIPLYEIRQDRDEPLPALELVLDPAGGVRLAGPPEDAGDGGRPVLVNGRTMTLLTADPPAMKGEPRFELTFTIDRERQLCLAARDLMTGTLIRRGTPVYQLT